MPKPIFKLSLVTPSEVWHALSPDEQKALKPKAATNLAAVGGKPVLMCDASWSNGEWQFFLVEQFPDMDAVQKHRALMNSMNWSRYLHQMFLFGTET